MTANKKAKRAVRARAEKTGLSYAATLNATRSQAEPILVTSGARVPMDAEDLSEKIAHQRNSGMRVVRIRVGPLGIAELRLCRDMSAMTFETRHGWLKAGRRGMIDGVEVCLDFSVVEGKVVLEVVQQDCLPTPKTALRAGSLGTRYPYIWPLSPTHVADFFAKEEQNRRLPVHMLMNPVTYTCVRKYGRDIVDIQQDPDKIAQGIICFMWGADLRIDSAVPDLYVDVWSVPMDTDRCPAVPEPHPDLTCELPAGHADAHRVSWPEDPLRSRGYSWYDDEELAQLDALRAILRPIAS